MATSYLIVYFSMTGRTRPIANEIRRVTGGDIEEIREPERREGLPGVLRGLVDAVLRRCAPILVPNRNPAQYDVVIVGGPVWAGRMASPVRTYAKRYLKEAKEVAFFCTAGGRKAESAFEDLQRLCGLPPRATWLVDAQHLEPDAHRAELAHFISQVRRMVRADEARIMADGVDRLA